LIPVLVHFFDLMIANSGLVTFQRPPVVNIFQAIYNIHALQHTEQFRKWRGSSNSVTVPLMKPHPDIWLNLLKLITRIRPPSLAVISLLSNNPPKEILPHSLHNTFLLSSNIGYPSFEPTGFLDDVREI
jgi:hypothetical protein